MASWRLLCVQIGFTHFVPTDPNCQAFQSTQDLRSGLLRSLPTWTAMGAMKSSRAITQDSCMSLAGTANGSPAFQGPGALRLPPVQWPPIWTAMDYWNSWRALSMGKFTCCRRTEQPANGRIFADRLAMAFSHGQARPAKVCRLEGNRSGRPSP